MRADTPETQVSTSREEKQTIATCFGEEEGGDCGHRGGTQPNWGSRRGSLRRCLPGSRKSRSKLVEGGRAGRCFRRMTCRSMEVWEE